MARVRLCCCRRNVPRCTPSSAWGSTASGRPSHGTARHRTAPHGTARPLGDELGIAPRLHLVHPPKHRPLPGGGTGGAAHLHRPGGRVRLEPPPAAPVGPDAQDGYPAAGTAGVAVQLPLLRPPVPRRRADQVAQEGLAQVRPGAAAAQADHCASPPGPYPEDVPPAVRIGRSQRHGRAPRLAPQVEAAGGVPDGDPAPRQGGPLPDPARRRRAPLGPAADLLGPLGEGVGLVGEGIDEDGLGGERGPERLADARQLDEVGRQGVQVRVLDPEAGGGGPATGSTGGGGWRWRWCWRWRCPASSGGGRRAAAAAAAPGRPSKQEGPRPLRLGQVRLDPVVRPPIPLQSSSTSPASPRLPQRCPRPRRQLFAEGLRRLPPPPVGGWDWRTPLRQQGDVAPVAPDRVGGVPVPGRNANANAGAGILPPPDGGGGGIPADRCGPEDCCGPT